MGLPGQCGQHMTARIRQPWSDRKERTARNDSPNRTARTGQAEQDRKIGQAEQDKEQVTKKEEQDSQNRTGRPGQQNKTRRKGQAEHYWQNRTGHRTGLPGQDCQDQGCPDRAASTGMLGLDSQGRTKRIGQTE
jgi:hypothetical protein